MNLPAAMGSWVLAAASLCLSARPAALEVRSARALDDADRASVMVHVRNAGARPVAIRDLKIGGVPLAVHLELSNPKNPRSPGKGVDWFDIRPRTVPAGGAGVIVLGYVARELREPRLELAASTDAGEIDLSCAPRPETLKVACAAFAADLKSLTLMVRNEGRAPAAIRGAEFNGRAADARVRGSPVPPGMVAVLSFPAAAELGAPCAVLVSSDAGTATASFRAYPAESLNYPFYGQHADRRDLAEKHMDVCVSREEAHAQVAEEIDRNGGKMPEGLAKSLAGRAGQFGKVPGAWAWYMQDDAGWGRPRPQTLVDLGRFLRESGSPQQQFLCNPADLARYAWTHDVYMNYHYHVTGQSADPTVFGGDRSLDLIRELNEPAPVLYLVDTVGQSARWITPAEEELASYAMLGRGAKHFGWFLVPSVWDQGTTLHGGIDPLETRPWRYQEGATACVPVWDHVGRIAGVLKALQPFVAASARLPGRLREDRIEVLPLLCKDDLVVITLLNRNLRCTYPRDFPDGTSCGGIQLHPRRNVAVSVPLPSWIRPAAVLQFDHDRGVRDAAFQASGASIGVTVEALDTVAVLLACASQAQAEALRGEIRSRLRPSVGGSPVRPGLVLVPEKIVRRTWDDPGRGWRAAFAAPAEGWVRARLPAEPGPGGPLGYFDPRSVAAFAQGRKLDVRVDYFRPVYRPGEGAHPWALQQGDRNASIEADPEGVKIVSRWSQGKYGLLNLASPLDPAYDVLEVRRDLSGRIEPLLAGANLRSALTGNVWGRSELLESAGNGLPISRIYWRRLAGDKEPVQPRLSAQVYDATYRFGEIRQCRAEPVVYVQIPSGGKAQAVHVYWDYLPLPCGETPVLPEADRPAAAAEAQAGPPEGFGIASIDDSGIVTEARAEAAWIETRDSAGALVSAQNLASADGLRWTCRGKPAGSLWVAGKGGRVVVVELGRPAPRPALKEIARVPGQVEALSCSPDGRLVVAGADKVHAFDDSGRPKWAFDLGENRRQQPRYGPGRNVDRVEVGADGKSVLASTFRWDEKTRRYENAVTVTLTAEGKETARGVYDWKGKSGSREAVPWPPYALHRFRLRDGQSVAATTQGRVQRLGADGRPAWEQRRPARIDAALLLEGKGLLAIAYKRALHRWDWQAAPVLELLSLKDGSTRALAEGAAADDFGHLGADLRLAADGEGKRIYLGDPSGRIYAFPVP